MTQLGFDLSEPEEEKPKKKRRPRWTKDDSKRVQVESDRFNSMHEFLLYIGKLAMKNREKMGDRLTGRTPPFEGVNEGSNPSPPTREDSNMSKITIGTCSRCGGPVEKYKVWMGVGPIPPARCAKCGATTHPPHGPIIDMK